MSERVPLPYDLVKAFVVASHARMNLVVDMLADEPALARASLDWGEGDWENGLEAAGHMGNREIAEHLLDHGQTPTVFSAAMMGEQKIVEPIVRQNASAAKTPGVHGISLIYHVAISGNVELAELVQSAADAPGKDDALHPAVKFGHLDMVTWLIDNGAQDLSRQNFQKQTPLQVAQDLGLEDIARLLQSNGAT